MYKKFEIDPIYVFYLYVICWFKKIENFDFCDYILVLVLLLSPIYEIYKFRFSFI